MSATEVSRESSILTGEASAAIIKFRFLKETGTVAGTPKLGPCGADERAVGIAIEDIAASGSIASAVKNFGSFTLEVNAASPIIPAGGAIKSGANGIGVLMDTQDDEGFCVARDPATADGALIEVSWQPSHKSDA